MILGVLPVTLDKLKFAMKIFTPFSISILIKFII